MEYRVFQFGMTPKQRLYGEWNRLPEGSSIPTTLFDLYLLHHYILVWMIHGATEGLDSDEEHWTDRLVAQGIPEYDVVFLYAVLQPDPTKRMTVDNIIETVYLDVY
ncbi:hypothetical protein P175DRAFT_0522359 [Aspergillus ochraceoroseus IBT 24754]|uniref:Protein kinase domain-containing protein n=1 Tax=Aspergillus ochraceoroseus IBT 24754 TaxID=1392256 RepID=A0A2T5M474_9EURO|nr:uncharacterized protein P175DRAFT_0522359 [Aspergillus ochraceoroseus IBT 24754]PTU23338.1 hypothetical protein P175DRAFT_0522359 [Aspergillus ochraceoroseus IBT 24754]